MFRIHSLYGLLLVFLMGCASTSPVATPPGWTPGQPLPTHAQSKGQEFAIATQGAATSKAAKRILAAGGNLADAAVAASFTASVERPQSTGIGGGGFLIFHEGKTNKIHVFDFRERAPQKTTPSMYLDEKGEVIQGKSVDGIHAVGVPGLVKGLVEFHKRFGKLPLETVMAPAIELAEKGFEVYPNLALASEKRQKVLTLFPASQALYLRKDGTPLQTGDLLIQQDLAKTLRKIAQTQGRDFYTGDLAKQIVAESQRRSGLLTLQDLRSYRVRQRKPVRAKVLGYEIVSMPPPSSGGTHVIQTLKALESVPLGSATEAPTIHAAAVVFQQAFRDRAMVMGDPDFVNVPVQRLISEEHASRLQTKVRTLQAVPKDSVKGLIEESTETTNLSLMAKNGDMIVTTQTINGFFGSGVVVPNTGILLNNEMDDFSAKPGASNIFGAVGSKANLPEPRKTPLSSMSPTLVLKDGVPVVGLGAPGGTRIITCVSQSLLKYLKLGHSLADTMSFPRFHHQWSPDELHLETGLPQETYQALKSYGYQTKIAPDAVPCRVQIVAREGEQLISVTDPRDIGLALAQ